jgi:hypothetical protein
MFGRPPSSAKGGEFGSAWPLDDASLLLSSVADEFEAGDSLLLGAGRRAAARQNSFSLLGGGLQ